MLKKWCAVLLAAAILLGSAIAVTAGSVYLRGDTDEDGTVTILDATLIQQVLAELKTDESGNVTKRGRITGKRLSPLDVTAIQRYIAGFEDPYEIGKTIGGSDYELPII